MSRLLGIIGFELRYYLRRISTWVYFGVLAGLAFLMVNLLGGAIPGANAAVGGSDGKVLVNSPYVIAVLTANVSLFGILVTAALAGHAGYRDFGHRLHPLAFTTPVSKWQWLGGRYVGTVLVNLVVLSGVGLGLWLGSLMPYLERDQFGPNSLAAYLAPYGSLVLPNLIFTAALFFSLAALTRQRLPHYAGGVALLIGYILASSLAGDVDDSTLAAMVDPFGFQALTQLTKYWTTVEKNASAIPLEGVLLGNRLLWLGLTALGVGVAVSLFRFRQDAFSFGRRTATPSADTEAPIVAPPRHLELPAVARSFSAGAAWAQFRTSLKRAFGDVVANVYFVAILFAGLLFLIFAATQVGELYGTPTHPVTYQVLEALSGLFGLFVIILITFYAGELVWHERDLKVDQVVDTTPSPGWVPYLAKGVALAAVVTCLMFVVLLGGVLTQLAQGYTRLELGLYAKTLFGFQLVDYLLLCVLALAVHAVVNHKYVGHLIVVLFFAFNIFRSQMGLEHALWGYGSDLGSTYSDMNRFGWFTWPWLVFKAYWGGVALLLALLSNLFWVRGRETHAKWRVSLARLRFDRPLAAMALLGGALALAVGGFILYNTNVLNEYQTSREVEQLFARYERDYRQYLGLPQPRIQAVSVEVDLYPDRGDLATRGTYRLRNETDAPLSAMHVRINPQAEVRTLSLDRPHAAEHEDAELGYRIWSLDPPLAPNAEATLEFDFVFDQRGFSMSGLNTQVVHNGSFVHSYDILPAFGYDPRGELSEDRTRKRHDLEPKERMRDLDDPEGRKNNYISVDADWVEFETTVSTSADQLAIAPGYLEREWTEGDRRYFHYAMDAPILNFFSFLSARYVVERDAWNDVAIEVWHHPGHEYNVARMIDAVKKSLEYYSREFSPYQHRQVRIVEFPRYATFAQSFPNTIPYSESIGFIAKVGEDDVDYPFYVTAHEIAHQWWAHQVVGADVQGSTVLTETLSQYSALMVMEEEYGKGQIRDFLEYELDRYLAGRAFEKKKELPLLRVENQQYIHYQKGALVMYRTQELLGAAAVNAALSDLIAEFGFQGPPYPTSRDLLRHLRANAPEKYHPELSDMLEHVVLYENKVVSATWQKRDDGRYDVRLAYEAAKSRAGELGDEESVPLRDHVQFGLWDDDEELIALEEVFLTEPQGEVTVISDRPPAKAGIDPLHLLVDRHPDDNEVDVTKAAPSQA